MANGRNKKLFPKCHLPVSIHGLVATFSCSDTGNCIIGKCGEYSSAKLSNDYFNTRSTSDNDSTSPSDISDVDGEDDNVDANSFHITNGLVAKTTSYRKSSLKRVSTSLLFC